MAILLFSNTFYSLILAVEIVIYLSFIIKNVNLLNCVMSYSQTYAMEIIHNTTLTICNPLNNINYIKKIAMRLR